jgi:hypothetical protein
VTQTVGAASATRPVAPGIWEGGPIQILQVPGCPLVGELRMLVDQCLADMQRDDHVEHLVGQYPSPTLLIAGVDVVTGHPVDTSVRCRLDLPSREQIQTALNMAANGD